MPNLPGFINFDSINQSISDFFNRPFIPSNIPASNAPSLNWGWQVADGMRLKYTLDGSPGPLDVLSYALAGASGFAGNFGAFGGFSKGITSADGFLFGGFIAKAPFNIPVQRFGNMNINNADFWGLRIGTSEFANRTFAAIKPNWNPLTLYTSGTISEGTVMRFGIIGPQGFNYPGGSLQFILNS